MDIIGLIKKINLMPNSKEKAMQICLISSYINFLVESMQISKEKASKIIEQINDVDVFLKHFVADEKKEIYSLLDSASILNPIYKDILNYSNNYPLFSGNIPNINIEKLINYAKDFLFYIDSDLLQLFNKLLDKDLIVESDINDFGGKCHKLNGDLSGIIIKYNAVDFYKVMTIIHEMGHAYYHYLNKSIPNLTRSNIANECIPRTLEQLFLVYLKDNYLIDENTINKYERFFLIHQLRLTNSVYIINNLLIKNIINSDFYPENIKAILSYPDYYELSIIKPKDNEFMKYLSFSYNYYSYAFILSQIIRENFVENPNETIKFIKEIPFLAIDMNAKEFIDLYDKNDYLSATKKNISRILSKKYYKK